MAQMSCEFMLQESIGRQASWVYGGIMRAQDAQYMGLNSYQSHVEAYVRYMIL